MTNTIDFQDNFRCDFYHLTMAQTLFLDGEHNKPETFEMYIRRNPFKGGYTVAAGLGPVLEWIKNWGYTDQQIQFLREQKTPTGKPMFKAEFIDMLKNTPLQVNIDAIPEGEVFFPNEPVARVTGPAWQCSMVETAFLNGINAASLIATKAARIVTAADGRNVMEFGLRRAQDRQGMMPTRAAAVGGILTTSNVDAAMRYGIKAVGTHAHSFVMHYKDEVEAFKAWLKHNPENATLLIDTYDTIQGAKNAVAAAKQTGVALGGVRLDSGDLVYLSKKVRKILDAGGFKNAKIVASNDLDERIVQSLIRQGAKIDIFGIGTNLVTAADQPALGGVYKVKVTDGRDCIKVSEDAIKTTIPGATEVVRMLEDTKVRKFAGDVIVDVNNKLKAKGRLKEKLVSVNLANEKEKVFPVGTPYYKPLVQVVRNGKVLGDMDIRPVQEIAKATKVNLAALDAAHKRFDEAHIYVAGLEKELFNRRKDMIKATYAKTGR